MNHVWAQGRRDKWQLLYSMHTTASRCVEVKHTVVMQHLSIDKLHFHWYIHYTHKHNKNTYIPYSKYTYICMYCVYICMEWFLNAVYLAVLGNELGFIDQSSNLWRSGDDALWISMVESRSILVIFNAANYWYSMTKNNRKYGREREGGRGEGEEGAWRNNQPS